MRIRTPEQKMANLEAIRIRRLSPEYKTKEIEYWRKRRKRLSTMPRTEQERARARRYYEKNRDKMRDISYKKLYGITLMDYEAMFALCGGLCRICKSPGERLLNVDHDHSTGKVRGLLCHRCNKGLGNFRDRIVLLESAITYLKDASPRHETGE